MFEVGCNAKMQVMASQGSKRGVHDKLDMANFCSHGRDDYNSLTSDIFQAIYSLSGHLYIVFLMQCMDVRSN